MKSLLRPLGIRHVAAPQTQMRFASKTTGGYTKNQHKKRNLPIHQFEVFLNKPVLKDEVLLTQHSKYEKNKPWVRTPDVHPGKNVWMNENYSIGASVTGIVSLRKDKHNPAKIKILDVEPDIQKVYRNKQLQRHARSKGRYNYMTEANEEYAYDELPDAMDPEWRNKALHKPKITEQFKDPNLLSRGVVASLRSE
jgi:hypothetical protein